MASMSVILQWIPHFILFFEIPNALVMSFHAPKPKRSKAGKAKKIGGRRYSSKRRSKSSYMKRLRGYLKYSAKFLFWMTFLWTFNVGWAISGKKRIKYMHCMNGNGPGKGKKGKGRPPSIKGSPSTFPEARQTTDAEYEDHDLLEQIKAALPQAAIIRAQSTLDPTEWDAPIVSPQLLDHRGGIALCPRDMVLGVFQRVGFTTAPTAILTSQPAQDFALKGFPQQRVQCSIYVLKEHGVREKVDVFRWLIQISYDKPVQQILAGPRVEMFTTMQALVAKYPARFGWPDRVPANLVAAELQKHAPQDAFAEITCRESKTASFLLHQEYTDTILKASGQGGVFYKMKKQEQIDDSDMPILWLDESHSLETALSLAEDSNAMGLVEKGTTVAGRYGVRFKSLTLLENFAKTNGIDATTATMGKWKLTGIPVQTGLAGAFAFLQTHKWTNVDIIYQTENQLVFLSDSVGDLGPMHCQFNGILRQLKYKATNAKARQMLKDANTISKETSASSTRASGSRAKDRQTFLSKVLPKQAPLGAPASPRAAEQTKRPAEKGTGSTPDTKKEKA